MKKQGECSQMSKEAGFSNLGGSMLCREAVLRPQTWEWGERKLWGTFSAHAANTFTWQSMGLRHLGPWQGHRRVNSMNSLQTPLTPCSTEVLMGVHLISHYKLCQVEVYTLPISLTRAAGSTPTSSTEVPGHVPERQQARNINNNPSL